MTDHARIREFVAANSLKYLDELKQACAIPSVSAEGAGFPLMTAWLEAKLMALGAKVSRLTVPGAPEALLGEISGAGERTLMIYDHYDVQPVDPVGLWESPPFEPIERDGRLYARGAADNKGDLVARLCALEAHRELYGELPFTVKFFIEGEEESGSVHFEKICRKYGRELSSDDCVWEGAWCDLDGRPAMYHGCKGLLYMELRTKRLSGDQHSSIAGFAPSAAWELLQAIASLKDPDGGVAVEGFYDGIIAPNDLERQLVADLPFNEAAMLEQLGITEFIGGLTGPALSMEMLYSPTVNIAGFHTGYGVPGATKTVLPAEAMAKLDFRLVPDQDADDVAEKVRLHLKKQGFEGVDVDVLSAENPSRSPVDSTFAATARRVAEQWFADRLIVYPFMWATGPMYPIAQGLGIPVCSPPGVARPDSNLHAPNENCRIEDFLKVIGYTVAYLAEYGRTPP